MLANSIDLLITILGFVLVLGFIIFLHELGHYLTSKLFKIEVEEFGFGFPPRIVRLFKIKETEFTLNWIPFGAFVRPKGENDPAVPGGLASANPWKRLVVLLGGPVMNLLTGIIIFAVVISQTGAPDLKSVQVIQVMNGSPAETSGLKPGDIVLSVNGNTIQSTQQISSIVNTNLEKEITLLVNRAGRQLSIHATPRANPPSGQGPLGIVMGNPVKNISLLEAVPYGGLMTFDQALALISLPSKLVQGQVKPEEARVVGPKGMFDIYQQAVEKDQESAAAQNPSEPAVNTLWLLATISVALGITNLLPIPALDGGRILFLLPELLLRKRVPQQYENMVHLIGFAVLILFMIYVTTQDIVNPIVLP